MASLSELSNQLKGYKTSYQAQLEKIQRSKTFQEVSKQIAIPQSMISGGNPQSSGKPIFSSTFNNPGFSQGIPGDAPGKALSSINFGNLIPGTQIVGGKTTNQRPQPGAIFGPIRNVITDFLNPLTGKPVIIQTSVPPIKPLTYTPGTSLPVVVTYAPPTQTLAPTIETPFPFFPSITTGEPLIPSPETSKPFLESLKEGFKQIPKEVLFGAGILGIFLLLRK